MRGVTAADAALFWITDISDATRFVLVSIGSAAVLRTL